MIYYINPIILEEVREMKKRGWVRLPVEALRDQRLSKNACIVLATIIDRADQDGGATLSAAQIARACNCSERTVKSCTAQLYELGYILIERHAGKRSRYVQCDVLNPKQRTEHTGATLQDLCDEYVEDEYRKAVGV